jgi:hypothetical protein
MDLVQTAENEDLWQLGMLATQPMCSWAVSEQQVADEPWPIRKPRLNASRIVRCDRRCHAEHQDG